MTLLRFSTRNHRSIRDEVTLDLSRPQLRTLRPRDDDWSAAAYPLIAVFGGNATGKSALLDAVVHALDAIKLSATTWQASAVMQRAPFVLDDESRSAPSRYEMDFVHDGRRYLYGFEVDSLGIKREWLRDVPRTRWRTLLDRDRDADRLFFHAACQGRIAVTDRELALSRALLLKNSPLAKIADRLVRAFDYVLVKDSHREARLASIADSLAEGSITFGDLETLLQVADIGIDRVALEEQNIPEPVLRALHRVRRALSGGEEAGPDVESSDDAMELEDDLRTQVVRQLIFTHRGSAAEPAGFSIGDESDGTIAWLAIAVPALEALRTGGLLLVDEIDASLHPHLLEVLLGAFADPLVNTHHAQLIFTCHESYVLSPLSDVKLAPEQIWLTDKGADGATELACLAEFPRHPDANVARRYLAGRYGGVPRLSPSTLAALVDSRAS